VSFHVIRDRWQGYAPAPITGFANERITRFHGGMLGQPFQGGEITRPVRFLDPNPKRSAQRHHQERFCKVGVLAEPLLQNPRQATARPSDFVRYGTLPRMRRDPCAPAVRGASELAEQHGAGG